MLEFQRHEIDKVSPQAGEDDVLEAEKTVVANAEKLARLSRARLTAALYDDDQADDDQPGHRLEAAWPARRARPALPDQILDARALGDGAARRRRPDACVTTPTRSTGRPSGYRQSRIGLPRWPQAQASLRSDPGRGDRQRRAAIADELGQLGSGDEALLALEHDAAIARLPTRLPPEQPSAPPGRTAAARLAQGPSRRRSPSWRWPGTRCELALHAIAPRSGVEGRPAAIGWSCCLSPNRRRGPAAARAASSRGASCRG